MAAPRQYSMSNNTAANDITGDRIQTKGTLSEQGRKNWDNIDWGARAREACNHSACLSRGCGKEPEGRSFKFNDSRKRR